MSFLSRRLLVLLPSNTYFLLPLTNLNLFASGVLISNTPIHMREETKAREETHGPSVNCRRPSRWWSECYSTKLRLEHWVNSQHLPLSIGGPFECVQMYKHFCILVLHRKIRIYILIIHATFLHIGKPSVRPSCLEPALSCPKHTCASPVFLLMCIFIAKSWSFKELFMHTAAVVDGMRRPLKIFP